MREEALRQVMAKLGIGGIETRRDRIKHATWLNASCPLAPWTHERGTDRRSSFGIVVNDTGTSIFQCWACHQKGSVGKLIRLLQKFRQRDYSDLFTEAEDNERGSRVYRAFDDPVYLPEDEIEPLDEDMWHGLFDKIEAHREAARFMVQRGVSRATCDKLGLVFDPEKRRVVFPVRHTDGLLYGFSGRTVIPGHEPKVLDYGGLPKRHLVLGAERWRPGVPKLLVEGLIAYARMHEIGMEETHDVGAILGSAMTDEKAAIVRLAGDTTVLLFDPDEAGDGATFGVFDPEAEERKIEESAIGKLYGHVPLLVPDFPDFPEGVQPDVDNLTRDMVLTMIAETRMWRPDRRQAKRLQLAGRGAM